MSSYYGVIFPEFWTGRTGRELREHGKDAQLLGLYLATNRHANMLGLYRLLVQDVKHETGMGQKAIERGFHATHVTGFATFDAASSYVWVRQMVRFRLGLRPGDGLKADDNRVAAVNRIYQAVDPNPFLGEFYQTYRRVLHLRSQREPQGVVVSLGSRSPFEGASEPLVSQVTDLQVQESGTELGTSTAYGLPGSGIREQEQEQVQGSGGAQNPRATTPTRQAFEHYHRRFLDRYHAKPEYGTDASERNKHAGNMARLLKKHGLDEVNARIDAYFDSSDPFIASSGHSLGLFFSGDVQTKLVAQRQRGGQLVSDRTRQNLANADEAQRLIQEGAYGHRR